MTSISGRAVASEPSPANPDIDANPYFILTAEADSAIAKGDYDRAAARLIDAMAVEPDNPGNLLLKTNLGIVYSALDRDSLATATLSDVISRAPCARSYCIKNKARFARLSRFFESYKGRLAMH